MIDILLQCWDNWRHPDRLTIREVEKLVEWFDSMDDQSEKSPFICNACKAVGIKTTKIRYLADWAYGEGLLVSRWVKHGVFHFNPPGSNFFGWQEQRLQLLENYLDYLYQLEYGDEV